MTVRARLLLAFAAVGVVLLLPSLYAVVRLGDLRDLAVENRARHAGTMVALGEVPTHLAEVDRFVRSYAATPSGALEARVRTSVDELARAAGSVAEMEEEGAAAALEEEVGAFRAAVLQVLELVDEGRMAAATDSVLALESRARAVQAQLRTVAATVDARADREFRAADGIASAGRRSVILGTGGAAAVALLVGMWTTGMLARPLERLGEAMGRVSEEEGFPIPADLPYDRRDEIGALAESFRSMTRRLAELDRLKVEFLGIASHELKTPLNVVRGYSELIQEELAGEITETQRDLLERIGEQTQVMSHMASRLMDLSRLESGTLGMQPEPVLVADLLTGLRRRFEFVAGEKGIRLELEERPDAPDRLEADVDLVRDEVLGNLVSNALRFTPEGGTVRVEARGAEDGALFEVSDTGPGVPEEHRAHIFERYYRAERARGLGTGLGLAICQQVVEAHGGWVRLADGAAPGATFHVFLPRSVDARAVGPERASPAGEDA